MLSDPCLNIAEWDLPSRVKSDYGMDVGTYMIEHHGPNHGSIITGCNIHNSRASVTFLGVLVFYAQVFEDMEEISILDPLNDMTSICIAYIMCLFPE